MHNYLGSVVLMLSLGVTTACSSNAEDRPTDWGKVWGGGEVTVTFTTDSGAGLEGFFTTPGSDRASIEDSFLKSTALWSYPWDVEGEPLEHRYQLSVNVSEDADLSNLDVTLRCPANTANLSIRLESEGLSEIDFGEINEYRAERPYRYQGIDDALTETGSVTAEIEWIALNQYCPGEGDPGVIGTGTITVDWAFDPDSEFVPDDHPIASVSDLPF